VKGGGGRGGGRERGKGELEGVRGRGGRGRWEEMEGVGDGSFLGHLRPPLVHQLTAHHAQNAELVRGLSGVPEEVSGPPRERLRCLGRAVRGAYMTSRVESLTTFHTATRATVS